MAENSLSDCFTEAVDERIQGRTSPSRLRSLDISGNKISDRCGEWETHATGIDQTNHTVAVQISPHQAIRYSVWIIVRRTHKRHRLGAVSKYYCGGCATCALICDKVSTGGKIQIKHS